MRWSIVLDSPAVTAKRRDEELTPETHESCVVLRLGPDAEGRRADLALAAGPHGLQVAVLAAGRAGAERPPHPEWYYRDHLVAFLDAGHDHATRWMYAVDDAGRVERQAHWIAPGEEPADRPSRELEPPPPARGEFRRLGDGRYWARLVVPHLMTDAPAAMPIGLRVKVGFNESPVPRPLTWPPQPEWAEDTPLAFGDLFAAPPPVTVESIEFREPAWGGEPSPVLVHLAARPDGPREGRVEATIILPEDSESSGPAVEWQASPDGRADVSVPVVFTHRAKWASDVRLTARLHLAVYGRDGEPRTRVASNPWHPALLVGRDGALLWSGEYPFGFDCGIIVRERFGTQGRSLPGRPPASAPDFIDRYRAYILARLPDYRRRTTREGSPSDFYLEDAEGGESVDLMAADWLDGVAAMLARRFPDWQDALSAAAMWTQHPCVTRHSAAWAPIASQVAVEDLPRLGGCFCGEVAGLLAALAEKLGKQLSVPLTGYTLGLRGHIVTLVETPIGRIVLDGMLGQGYPALDNSRLATLEEMRQADAIVRRLWYLPRAHGHEFYCGIRDQILVRRQRGPLRFPAAL